MSMGMYNAILKWSLQQSDGFTSEEGDKERAQTMSEERKEFLRKAMKQYIVNETERINDIVEVLKFVPTRSPDSSSSSSTASQSASATTNLSGSSQSENARETASTTTAAATAAAPSTPTLSLSSKYHDVIKAAVDIKVDGGTPDIQAMLRAVPSHAMADMKLEALLELQDRIEQIDNANFFACKCNGSGELELVLDLLLKHPDDRIRVAAGSVLSAVLQNNDTAQDRAGKIPNFMAALVAAVDAAGESATVAHLAKDEKSAAGTDGDGVGNSSSNDAVDPVEQAQDLQTSVFNVLSSYVRGATAATRLSQFLTADVNGPELLSRILQAAGTPALWQKYTPPGKKKPRGGWWRKVSQGLAVPIGSEVAMDLSSGTTWIKYQGKGNPPAAPLVNERLVKKALFFLRFLIRETSGGAFGGVGALLGRLGFASETGSAMALLVGNLHSADMSESAAAILMQILQLSSKSSASAPTTASRSSANSQAIVALPSASEASINSGSSSTAAGEVEGKAQGLPPKELKPMSMAKLQAAFRSANGASIIAACKAQREALIKSAAGDEEMLGYLQEPLQLFKSLSDTIARK